MTIDPGNALERYHPFYPAGCRAFGLIKLIVKLVAGMLKMCVMIRFKIVVVQHSPTWDHLPNYSGAVIRFLKSCFFITR